MKRQWWVLVLVAALAGLVACSEPGARPDGVPAREDLSEGLPEAESAWESERPYTLQGALELALADERNAQDTYRAVMARFGEVRPFVNIVQAEVRHEEALLPLFARYGLTAPARQAPGPIALPETLAEVCALGAQAERDNIALYDRYLGEVMEEDVREVFVALRDASEDNHLPAFLRCAEGGGQGGGGR
jgi:hypothetical protein